MKFFFLHNWPWLCILPVLIGALFLVYRRVKEITGSWFEPPHYQMSYPGVKLGLRTVGLVLMLIALMGPYLQQVEKEVTVLGREVYFLLDVSASMNCEDLQPSRLEKAKAEIAQCIRHFRGDKVGIIAFGDYAYVQCPLTRDYQAALLFLDMLNTRQYAQTGTQFRNALAVSLDRLLKTPSQGPRTQRAVVLISDGEDFGDNYLSLLDRLKRSNINLYTVGVGRVEGSMIPKWQGTQKKGIFTQPDGNPILSRREDQSLKKIANYFGTEYVPLSHNYADLAALETQLQSVKANAFSYREELIENNLYAVFLIFALLCLVTSLFILPMTRPSPQAVHSSSNTLNRAIGLSVLWVFIGPEIQILQQAAQLFHAQKYQESIAQYRQAREELPHHQAPIDYNMGQAFMQLGAPDSAMRYYQASLDTEDKKLASMATNNMGLIHIEREAYPLAAADFRQALTDDPDNELARYNYELVMRLLHTEIPLDSIELPPSTMPPSPQSQNPPPIKLPPPPDAHRSFTENSGQVIREDSLSMTEAMRILDLIRKNEQQYLQQLRKSVSGASLSTDKPTW